MCDHEDCQFKAGEFCYSPEICMQPSAASAGSPRPDATPLMLDMMGQFLNIRMYGRVGAGNLGRIENIIDRFNSGER